MKNKKAWILILLVVIIITQLITKIYIDFQKSDFFIDEFYSYALMNYKIPFIFEEETFLNTWHDNEYFKDYVSIQRDEVFDLSPVYNNQVADVHPPFYYLLLRIASTFFIDEFSKWPGLLLNLIIYVFSAIMVFKIANELFKNRWYSLIAVLIYGFSVFSMENTLYIRMYQLLELHLLLIAYWHIKNYAKELKLRNYLLLIPLTTLGFLTHYYYILFLIGLYFIYAFYYIRKRQIKSLLQYTGTLLVSGALILAIFPHCLTHIFFGYRGSNSLYKLFNFTNCWNHIKEYLSLVNVHIFFYGFAILFITLILVKIILVIRSYIKARKFNLSIKKEVLFITVPTIVYLFVVMFTSPFADIRYILPILIFILLFTIYLMKNVLNNLITNKKVSFALTSLLLVALTIPTFFLHNRFLYLYADQKQFYEDLKENYGSLPCVYIYKPNSEMFNNFVYNYNFLLQSKHVYITSGIYPDTAQDIIKSVDTSNGILMYDELFNLPNILRFVELDEFNSYRVIGESYTGSIIYIYYDENVPNNL